MKKRLLITGSSGLVGSSISKVFKVRTEGTLQLLCPSRQELDLTDRTAVFDYFETNRPDIVVNCAAEVGGILANKLSPISYGSNNSQIQVNVLDASYLYKVNKFLFFGSSCIYPISTTFPLQEDNLFSGTLDASNRAFASAKLAGISLLEAYRSQFDLSNWITVIPTSIYGPNDCFDVSKNHVIPALVSKIYTAKVAGINELEMYGDGTALREFLFNEDLAEAIYLLLSQKEFKYPRYNIGSGSEISISQLVKIISEKLEFKPKLRWGSKLENGVQRKLIDSSRIFELGFMPKYTLESGIEKVIESYLSDVGSR